MSDLIERADALRLLKEDWDASASRGDDERAEVCKFHYIEISNIPTAESTGALDDAIQEYINKGYMLPAEPLVTVKAKQNEGLYLDTDEETLLETEYIVVATDGWYKEYIHETDGKPKVGKWIRIGYDIYECSECHQYVKTSDIDAYDWCHHCGAKMERSE